MGQVEAVGYIYLLSFQLWMLSMHADTIYIVCCNFGSQNVQVYCDLFIDVIVSLINLQVIFIILIDNEIAVLEHLFWASSDGEKVRGRVEALAGVVH